jgi:hypothetical protein
MKNVFLVKIDDYNYRIGGTLEVMGEKDEYIEKDGKRFTHTERYFYNFDLCEDFKKANPIENKDDFGHRHYWRSYKTTFCELFGKPEINIYYTHQFSSRTSWFGNSDNEYVDFITELVNFNFDELSVLGLSKLKYGSRITRGKESYTGCSTTGCEVSVYSYGFNNHLFINVNLNDFFKYDLYKHTNTSMREIEKFSQTFKNADKNKTIPEQDKIKILTEIINNKTKWKQ